MDQATDDGRLERARQWRAQLEQRGIWFAPIRHHSPACATAVRQLIDDVGPTAVLIEGPTQYDALIPALTDPATRPPIAVLSVRETTSYFYPLADFSPEWVGLKAAAASGARIAFIDQPFTTKTDDQGLASERYYAHSQALARLAEAEHCRDHDELWEHLFELQPRSWQSLFDQVFSWSALARFDYEPEVLEAEGSLSREAVMAWHINHWRETWNGPLVVITGAFHTLALIETLAAPDATFTEPAPSKEPAWLIRYDLARLGSLTGYGAGIRSPGYYERQWRSPSVDVTTDLLTDIARLANEAGASDRISVAQVIEAGLQANRLAELRGHARPGRTDLLDACTSCFEQSDLAPAVRDAIGEVLGGTELGDVPPGTAAPPIVAEARSILQRLRLVSTDSQRHAVALDVHRVKLARQRSRFFWLMSFLDVGFVRYVAGPDYIAGRDLNRLNEQWEYAWTPMVEAGLIGLIGEGATLREVASHRLHSQEQQRSAQSVAQLVARAALIGLDDELERLRRSLDVSFEQDPSLASVLGAIRQILSLWRARDVLEIAEPDLLLQVVQRAAPQVSYLLGQAAHANADAEPEIIGCLIGAQDLIRTMADHPSVDMLRDGLARLRREATAPGVQGAVLALGVATGDVTMEQLSDKVVTAFAPGADTASSLRFFDGVMRAAPDLLLHTPELFAAVDRMVGALDADEFLAILPDLRRSFARLRPSETARIAERVAVGTGLRPEDLDARIDADESDLRLGAAVEAALLESLKRDCLAGVIAS